MEQINYWYDGSGSRIRKQTEDVDEIYVYGADGQTEAVFDADGSLKFFNINAGNENLGRLNAAAYELRLKNITLSGNYNGSNIIVETNVTVTGTAELKAGSSIILKPGFHAVQGCSFTAKIDANLIVEPERYYYLKDHLGSVRITVDETGEIASYDDYDPWGMQLDGRSGNFGLANEKYKFTGKERDTETNYDYFGARYYDSRIGRWLQVDPLADKYPGWSTYNYAFNNPIIYYDPDGKGPWDIIQNIMNTVTTKVAISESIAERKHSEAVGVASEIGGIHNGKADAWRHASWSKESSEAVGKEWTAIFGIFHEVENLISGSPVKEVMMDLTNNKKGREAAGTDTDLKEMAKENELTALNPENLVRYEYKNEETERKNKREEKR